MKLEVTLTPAEMKDLLSSHAALWRISEDGLDGTVRDVNICKLACKLLRRALDNLEKGKKA